MLTPGTYNGIKSIQSGQVNIYPNTASGSAAVTAVNVAKSVLIPLGQSHTFGAGDMSAVFALANATTVTLSRVSALSGSVVGNFVLVEYY